VDGVHVLETLRRRAAGMSPASPWWIAMRVASALPTSCGTLWTLNP